MFGGIIKYQGIIREVRGDKEKGLSIRLEAELYDLVDIGDSVGINGVCLTVTRKEEGLLDFDIWPESLKRTTLTTIQTGQSVHADLPLRQNDFIGGHPVLGHVDYVGTVAEIDQVDNSGQLRLWIDLPSRYTDLVPLRGCVAVDGVSLTVTAREEHRFSVSLIPETLRMTHLGQIKEQSKVNIEIDTTARSLRDSDNLMTIELPKEVCSDSCENQLQWAIDNISQGGFCIIYDNNKNGAALCAASDKLSSKTLGFALSLSHTPCTVAISTAIAEQLAIPAPVINSDANDRRRYLLPVSHIENKIMDFSAEALLRSLSIFTDDFANLSDWKAPGNVTPVQIFSSEEGQAPGLYEAAVALNLKANLPAAALCQILLDSDCHPYSQAQAEALATRFQIPLLQVEEIIKSNDELRVEIK